MEAPDLGGRPSNRSEGRKVHGIVDRRRGDRRRVPAAYGIASGRLLVRPPADDPAFDAPVPVIVGFRAGLGRPEPRV